MIAVRRIGTLLVTVAVLVGLSLLIVLHRRTTGKAPDINPIPPPNKAYSAYQYGETNTVYVGTQPLYAPTGLITEAMKRDAVLQEELLRLGLRIVFYPFEKGYDVNTELVPGRIQVGIGGDMPTLTAAITTDIIIPIRVQSGPTWLVTRTPLLMKDLKGKRIGYAEGSNAHFMLLSLLSSSDLLETDVELVPMPVSRMIEALDTRSISAFAAWEPTPTIARQKHGFVTRFGASSSGYMYFRRDFADRHPEALRSIVAAVVRARLWLRDGNNEDHLKVSSSCIETAEILTGRKFPLSPETMISMAERDILGIQWRFSLQVPSKALAEDGALRREHAFLKTIDFLPEASLWADVRGSFDLTTLQGILETPKKYRLSEFRYGTQVHANTQEDINEEGTP